MFLNKIKNNDKKGLFLELAGCICFASSIEDQSIIIENVISRSKNNKDDFVYHECMTKEKLELLRTFAIELELWNRFDNSQLFDNNENMNLVEKFEIFFNELKISNLDMKYSGEFGYPYLNGDFIIKFIDKKSEKIIEEKATDQGINNKLASILANIKHDEISPKLIKNIKANFTEVKQIIMERTVKEILEKSEPLSFTNKEKKAFLFELIGMTFSDGKIEEAEISLVKIIAKYLKLSKEDVEELIASVIKMNISIKEAINLINE